VARLCPALNTGQPTLISTHIINVITASCTAPLPAVLQVPLLVLHRAVDQCFCCCGCDRPITALLIS
jgi:hypothetical protein